MNRTSHPRTPRQHANENALEAMVEMKRKYARVHATEDGQFVLNDIINRLCRFDQDCMNISNPIETYANASKRDVGNAIRRMIHEKVNDGKAS